MPVAPCFYLNCLPFTLVPTRSLCPTVLWYSQRMKWPHWYPTWADIVGVLFVVALMGVVAAAAIMGPQQRTNNEGFGPDWDCMAVPPE
jgi:hypothetical protein